MSKSDIRASENVEMHKLISTFSKKKKSSIS